MFNISRRDVEEAYSFADRALKSARDPDARPLSSTVKTLEVMGGAFIAGVAAGALGGEDGSLNVPGTGVPADLAVGIALKATEFTGYLGGASSHLGNVADGVLGFYSGRMGVGVGKQHRKGPPRVAGTPKTQELPAGAPTLQPLTEAELVALGTPR